MAAPVTVCGRSCSLTLASNSYSAHGFTLSLAGRETDVTSFGSTVYGDYKVCIIDGMITAQCYEKSALMPDDVISISANVGASVLTFANCKVISNTSEIDSKNIVNHVVVSRITQPSS